MSSGVFGLMRCLARFPACDVLFLTVAVMSPATGISRLVLCLVPFALLTDASGCYHMWSGLLHDDLGTELLGLAV